MPNTQLSPLDLDNLKEPTKKTKQLTEAYDVARQKNDLDHFKRMLYDHQKEQQEWEAELERKEAEKEAKKAKKAEKTGKPAKSRKSKGGDDEDEDTEIVDAEDEDAAVTDSAKKSKSSKKRKKDEAGVDDDADGKVRTSPSLTWRHTPYLPLRAETCKEPQTQA